MFSPTSFNSVSFNPISFKGLGAIISYVTQYRRRLGLGLGLLLRTHKGT
jgi:hypothetical protein